LRAAAEAGARLSTPAKAAISGERKVQANPAEKTQNVCGTADPDVSVLDRVNNLKGEHLTVMSGKLKCDACKETEFKKKSYVVKHIAVKKVIAKSKKKDQGIHFFVLIEDKVIEQRWLRHKIFYYTKMLRNLTLIVLIAYFFIRPNKGREQQICLTF